MFGKDGAGLRKLLTLLTIPLVLSACSSSDDGSTGPGGDEIEIRPVSANYWPMDDGASWTFIRRIKTDSELFLRLAYEDYDVQMAGDVDWTKETPLNFLNSPYIHLELDGTVDTPEGLAQVLRGTRSSAPDGSVNPVNQIELWVNRDADRIRYLGENTDAAIDSIFWDSTSFDWIRFGELRWELLIEDYSGEENGMVSFGEALGFPNIEGFGSHRDFDFDTPLNSEGIPSDMEKRFWPDSLISISLVNEAAGVVEVAYDAMFGFNDIEYFPEMADTVFSDCIWVLQSIEFEMHLTNQRNPNAGPGESGIPAIFIPERVRRVTVKQPRRLILLAPNLGPIRIVTYIDLDWRIMPAELYESELKFPADFMEIDYLMDSSYLH